MSPRWNAAAGVCARVRAMQWVYPGVVAPHLPQIAAVCTGLNPDPDPDPGKSVAVLPIFLSQKQEGAVTLQGNFFKIIPSQVRDTLECSLRYSRLFGWRANPPLLISNAARA